MPAASGPNVSLSYVMESVQGVTPTTPTMKELRVIGKNINTQKGILRSPEISRRRMRRSVRHGMRSVAGSLPFNLGMLDQDDVLACALSGAFVAVTSGATTIEAVAAGNIFRRPAGSWITDKFTVGMPIASTGFTAPANNNPLMVVTSVSAGDLAVSGATLANEAAGAARTVEGLGESLLFGTTLKTMTIERRFEDLGSYQQFTGVTVNGFTLNLAAESMIGGTYDLIGIDGSPLSATTLGTPEAVSSNEPFDSFTGRLMEGDVEIGVITGMSITIANNRQGSAVLMRKTTSEIFEGAADITGRLTAELNEDLFNKFDVEAESSIDVQMLDLNGVDFHRFRLPRVKYLGAAMDPPQTGPVLMDMPFEAIEDPVLQTALVWQKSNETV